MRRCATLPICARSCLRMRLSTSRSIRACSRLGMLCRICARSRLPSRPHHGAPLLLLALLLLPPRRSPLALLRRSRLHRNPQKEAACERDQ
jgi:hypothetical protein